MPLHPAFRKPVANVIKRILHHPHEFNRMEVPHDRVSNMLRPQIEAEHQMLPESFDLSCCKAWIGNNASQPPVLIQPFVIILCEQISILLRPLVELCPWEGHRMLEEDHVWIQFFGKLIRLFNRLLCVSRQADHEAAENSQTNFLCVLRELLCLLETRSLPYLVQHRLVP